MGGLGDDTMDGGAGVDTASYANASAGVTVNLGLTAQQNTVGAGLDTLANFENLTGSNLNDTLIGNALANVISGGLGNDSIDGGGGVDTASYATAGAAVNASLATGIVSGGAGSDTLISIENLVGSNFNDTLTGNAGVNVLTGGAGSDVLSGGAGADLFVFNSKVGADTISDFLSGTDKFRVSQAGIHIGNGDTVVDNGVVVAGPGGFATASELVIVSGDIAGAINATSAAAAIGSATSAYAIGDARVFAVDNGAGTEVFLFTSAAADATVSAAELTLLGTATATPATLAADYVFVG
jgi:Ca2+-binding RTX toxin-like protein